jgi:PAS domain S-box-containing protein
LQNEAHARHLNVSLFDVTNPTERLMIYGETSALSSEIMAGNLNPEREEEELYPTPFANRHWLLLVSPTEEMASTRSRWLFLLTLTAGLIITALVYAFLDSFARHTREVEEKVGDRTHQLSKANALLADQIRQKEAVFEELSKSETRFRLLTENSTDIIARHDLEGVCLYASSAAKHLLGYDPEEMVGHSIYPLLYKSDIDPMRKLHSTLLDSDEVYTIVYRAKHKDGHYIWFEASCLAIRDEETGEAAEIQSVSRDITARKKAEEALRENEERFRGAFEDAAIGMALVDDSGKIQRVNHSLCQISGYPREELISSDLQSITHPADMAQSLEKMAMVLEGRARVFHLETRLMHKKGYIVWAMISATLVRNHSDEAGYFVMQVQDITDRKRAEKALESLNTKHKLILNAAGEGIVGLDTEGRVTFANLAAEKLLGYELGELQGKPFHSWVLHTREDATPYPFRDSPLFQALHLGKTNSVPMELFWRKDQSNFKASYVCAPIQTQESISGAVIVFSDASETQIGTMARKLMRGESPTRKKIWSEEGNDPGGASS